jgi:TATA-box binding protein (TBP) (component of TFIID and TFIIIB)
MTLVATTDAQHLDLRAYFLRVADAVREGSQSVIHVSMLHQRAIQRVGRVLKTNGRPKTFGSQMFDNQATVVVRCADDTTLNVKTFRNGNLQMTGARSVDGARAAVATVLALMAEPGAPPPAMSAPRVCLMNADYALRARVDRQFLYDSIVAAGLVCSYQPSIYPAVKTYFMWHPTEAGAATESPGGRAGVCPASEARGGNGGCGCGGRPAAGCCKRVTVLVFYTGAIIITGATAREHIDAAFRWVIDFVFDTPGVLEEMAGERESGVAPPGRKSHKRALHPIPLSIPMERGARGNDRRPPHARE